MIEAVLGVATVLGGVAAAWFFWDKARTVKWRRPHFSTSPPTRTITKNPIFPDEVEYAVDRAFPDYRLPGRADMQGDWAEYGDMESLSPFMCVGDFTGCGGKEYALFVLGRDQAQYKAIAFTRNGSDELVPHELQEGTGLPTRYFLRTVEPGYYRPGPSAWYFGLPRIVRLKHQGINIGMFESADRLLYWDGAKFVETWMSD